MKKAREFKILHACKKIIDAEKALSDTVDDLLNEIGITRQGFLTGGGLLKRGGKNVDKTANMDT